MLRKKCLPDGTFIFAAAYTEDMIKKNTPFYTTDKPALIQSESTPVHMYGTLPMELGYMVKELQPYQSCTYFPPTSYLVPSGNYHTRFEIFLEVNTSDRDNAVQQIQDYLGTGKSQAAAVVKKITQALQKNDTCSWKFTNCQIPAALAKQAQSEAIVDVDYNTCQVVSLLTQAFLDNYIVENMDKPWEVAIPPDILTVNKESDYRHYYNDKTKRSWNAAPQYLTAFAYRTKDENANKKLKFLLRMTYTVEQRVPANYWQSGKAPLFAWFYAQHLVLEKTNRPVTASAAYFSVVPVLVPSYRKNATALSPINLDEDPTGLADK